MLYILPPPTAKPPSVWDLIINFHRKGCQDPSGNQSSANSSKKSLKFDCRETKKSQRTWCKTSPSDQSHVSERDYSHDLKKHHQFHFLAKDDGWTLENLFAFPSKTRLDFPSSSMRHSRFEACCGKW